MKLGKTLYVAHRRAWRSWLAKHHKTATEIWLISFKKHTKKPSVPYNDAVEEALAYGWIDSTVKTIDQESYAQRFSPRKPGSNWSEMNMERVRRLIKEGKMTRAGLAVLKDTRKAQRETSRSRIVVPPDIRKRLRADRSTRRLPCSPSRICCWNI